MHDILIKNGTILDGTGGPWIPGRYRDRRSRITTVGDAERRPHAWTIDAAGKIVAPGFIDLHSHADFVMPLADHDRVLKPLVDAGGHHPSSAATAASPPRAFPRRTGAWYPPTWRNLSGRPMDDIITWRTPAEYISTRSGRRGCCSTWACWPGTARSASPRRASKPSALSRRNEEMERLLEESLEMGCLGLSTGLQYFPAR